MHTKQVTATHTNGSKYVWTDDSKQSLEDWKAKRKDCTFSALEDNPEVAKIAAIKAHLQKIDDPDPEVSHHSIKVLLRHILKDLMED